MNEINTALMTLAPLIGTGGLGYAVGYFVKKLMKIALFVVGGILMLLVILERSGMISINFDNTQHVLINGAQYASDQIASIVNELNKNMQANAITAGALTFAGGFGLAIVKS